MELLQMNEKTAPELPENWVWTRLGEIIDKVPLTGKKLKQKEYQIEGRFPVVDQGRAFIGGYTNKEDVLICCDSPVIVFGDHTKVVKYVDFDFAAGADGIKVMKPHVAFYPKLFFHFVQAVELPDKGYARHFQFLEKSRLPLPPLPEQRRIVTKVEELFTQLDVGVGALTKARTQLKHYRQSVLKSACEGRLVPTEAELTRVEGRDYEPADVLLARIQKERREKWEAENKRKGKKSAKYKEPEAPDVSGLPELPEGWIWTLFHSLLKEPLRNGHSAKSSSDEHGIRTLTLSAVTQRDFSEKNTKITVAKPEKVKDIWLKHEDILIERSNTAEYVGLSAIYLGKDNFAIFPDLLIRARVVPSYMNPQFVECTLRAPLARKYFKSKAQGISGSMPKIGQRTIEGLPTPLPPLLEQHRIVAEIERRLSVADEIEKTIDQSLKQAERLRRSILKKAFEGKLVPQDPNDEPASVLLERIKAEKAKREAEKKTKNKRKRKDNPKQKRLV